MNPWWHQAACKDVDTNIFFEDYGGKKDARMRESIAKALAYCDACPVRSECLDYAIVEDIKYGIFGGMTPKQRIAYRKRNSNKYDKIEVSND